MHIGNSILERVLSKLRYRNVIISISHFNYLVNIGGTEKVIGEEQRICYENGISHIHLFPEKNGLNGVLDYENYHMGISIDAKFIDYFNINQIRAIWYVLDKMKANFLGINIHHTLGIKFEVLDKLMDGVSDNINFFFT